MKRDVIDIVKEKEFIALTDEERNELANYCNNEDEYNQLKHVLLGVDAMAWTNPQPKRETKERLDVLFGQTHPKAAVAWYGSTLSVLIPKGKPLHRQPLMQIAALALLVLLTVPFFQSEEVTLGEVLVAENPREEDTDLLTKNEAIVTVDETLLKEDAAILPAQPTSRDALTRALPSEFGASNPASAGLASISTESRPPHPDGIYNGDESITYSLRASDQPEDLLDLLTSTF